MKKYIINFLLLISGIAVIYLCYSLMGLLQLLQYKLIELDSAIDVIQFLLMILRFLISQLKNVLPSVLCVVLLYQVTTLFLNLQMSYKSKHILSFSIYILLCLGFIILIALSPDPVLMLQFKFKEAFDNCNIKMYLELFNVESLKAFINVILTHLFEFIFHILLVLILIWASFFAAHKLHDYYGYYYQ